MRADRSIRRLGLTACACLALAGCGSTVGLGLKATAASSSGKSGGNGSMSNMAGMSGNGSMNNMPGMSGSGGTSGMNPGAAPKINGVPTAVASQVITTSYWQGMKIQARTATPVPFLVFNGTRERMIKPGKSSFHLMIMLSDEHTGVAIPYASVWATITNNKGFFWSEQQWQMISAYMGPHYGNDVPHLAPGRYKLKLLISPPVSARHVEYAHVWLKPHTVTTYFTWNPRK